jgi:hypothetical protein
MNGGVSLAVWMGGVAHEIDNLRRASHRFPQPEGCDPQEAAVLDLWGKFCAEHGTRVTVDVIGGTSAGGLNGVLLATAIARGMPLTGLRELWKKSAQLSADALLTPQQGGAASVLNGDFFLGKIQQALQAIGPADTGQGRDVTLTVTATSLTGDGRELHDTAGESFTEADHRRRYEFRRVRRPVTYEQGPDGGPPHFTPQPLRTRGPGGTVIGVLPGRVCAGPGEGLPPAFQVVAALVHRVGEGMAGRRRDPRQLAVPARAGRGREAERVRDLAADSVLRGAVGHRGSAGPRSHAAIRGGR